MNEYKQIWFQYSHLASLFPTGRVALKRTGAPYSRIDDLRSTYATRLSAGGVADEWVTQLPRQERHKGLQEVFADEIADEAEARGLGVIVGLHFLPLARLFRCSYYYWIGAIQVMLCLGTAIAMPSHLDALSMVAGLEMGLYRLDHGGHCDDWRRQFQRAGRHHTSR
jgi:hypothetical protein